MHIAVVIIKLAILLHITGIAVASTMDMESYQLTLIPIALITIILSRVQFGTYLKLSNYLFHILPIAILITGLVIPALVLLIAMIRKKTGPEAAGNGAPGGTRSAPALIGGDPISSLDDK